MKLSSRAVVFFAVLLTLLAFSTTMFAAIHTAASPKARVTSQVDDSKRTTLTGHVPAAARHGMDMGRVESGKQAEHLIMVLKSDEEQKREIRRVLDEQQDKRTEELPPMGDPGGIWRALRRARGRHRANHGVAEQSWYDGRKR